MDDGSHNEYNLIQYIYIACWWCTVYISVCPCTTSFHAQLALLYYCIHICTRMPYIIRKSAIWLVLLKWWTDKNVIPCWSLVMMHIRNIKAHQLWPLNASLKSSCTDRIRGIYFMSFNIPELCAHTWPDTTVCGPPTLLTGAVLVSSAALVQQVWCGASLSD